MQSANCRIFGKIRPERELPGIYRSFPGKMVPYREIRESCCRKGRRAVKAKLTAKEYGEMAKKASPPTRSHRTIPAAFLTGGAICTGGEGLLNLYQYLGMDRAAAGAAVSVTLIFLAALLTGLDLYPAIARFAGAGTLVPITGFSNSVAAPALEFRAEGLVPGLGAKLFVIAGPVLVYGISASIVYGLILYLFHLY